MPAFWVSTCLHVEHRRPSACDAPHEGLLKVERRGLRYLGFRGFRGVRGVKGSVSGRTWFLMESDSGQFHPNFDETVPNLCGGFGVQGCCRLENVVEGFRA